MCPSCVRAIARYSFGEEERSERDNLKRAAFSGDVDMSVTPVPRVTPLRRDRFLCLQRRLTLDILLY